MSFTIPYHTIPYNTTPNHTTPYNTTQHNTTPGATELMEIYYQRGNQPRVASSDTKLQTTSATNTRTTYTNNSTSTINTSTTNTRITNTNTSPKTPEPQIPTPAQKHQNHIYQQQHQPRKHQQQLLIEIVCCPDHNNATGGFDEKPSRGSLLFSCASILSVSYLSFSSSHNHKTSYSRILSRWIFLPSRCHIFFNFDG